MVASDAGRGRANGIWWRSARLAACTFAVCTFAVGAAALPARAETVPPPPPAAAAEAPASTSTVVAPPPPSTTAPAPTGLAPVAAPNVTAAAATSSAVYGVAMRARWVSVPKWVLNIFTDANHPLSSYHVGAEFFRRKGAYDLVLGLSYQSMSPPDGNWLGRGNDPSVDTDYVQFKGLGFVSFDVGFIWHQAFTEWFGMHYGGGIGLGVVTGKMLRTSSSAACTKSNIYDVSQCHPLGIYPVTDQALQKTEGGIDTPESPHRYQDSNVPSVVPVLNIQLGLDFKIPTIPGLEVRVEGGFYDAFFLGGAIGYVFL